MRFSPSSTYLVYANSISPSLIWNVYQRTVSTLASPLTSGSWNDVTDYIPSDNISIKTSTEYAIGQYKIDSLSITAIDVNYWKTNVFTTSVINNSSQYIELKFNVSVGLNDRYASDTVIPFSGIVDKEAISFNEESDTVTFTLNTIDYELTKLLGETYTMQPIRSDVYGSTDGLVLMNIPGVWVSSATSSTPLLPGVHTLTWNYESGSATLKLDDGNTVAIATASNNSYNLFNKDSTQKVTVVSNYSYFVTGTKTQDLILTASATYPKTWNQNVWIYQCLTDLYRYCGVSNLTFDNFRLKTYDSRKVISFYDIPITNSFYDDVRCMTYDSTAKELYMGVGDKLVKRNMTTNTYTDYGIISSSYKIVKLFNETLNSGFISGIAKNTTNNSVIGFSMNTASLAKLSCSLSGRGTLDATVNFAGTNFAYNPSFSSLGSIFYYGASDGKVKYYRIGNNDEVDTGFIPSGAYSFITPYYGGASWCSGSDWYCQADTGTSTYQIFRVYYSGSTWNAQTMLGTPSTTIISPFKTGVYNPSEQRFIGSVPLSILSSDVYGDGNVYGVYVFNHPFNSTGVITGSCATYNHTYGNNAVYFYERDTRRFGMVTGSAFGNTVTLTDVLDLPPRDLVEYGNKSLYDPTEDKYYGVTKLNNILFEYSATSSMYISTEFKGTDKSLFEMVGDILKAYNLTATINSNKDVYVFRRGDDTGEPVTLTNSTTLTEDNISSVTEDVNKFAKIGYIKIVNETDTSTYDGNSFNVLPISRNTRTLTLNSVLLPSNILDDVAYYFYQYFNTNRTVYRVELPYQPYFHLEPFDGVTLSLPTRNITVNSDGIIYSVQNSLDGTTVLEIII